MRTAPRLLPLLIAVAIAVVVTVTSWPERRPAVSPGTNVVLIMIDTLRADHLGSYGYERDTSPHIDDLAARGVVFEQVFTNSTWTRPSIASLLTGAYPRQTGVYKEQFDSLRPEVAPLAELFKEAGFATYGVTANPSINAAFGFDRGFDRYGDCGVVWPWMDEGRGARRYKRGEVPMEDAASLTDRAISLMLQHRGGRFYLQVLYIDPHWPYEAPDEVEQALLGGRATTVTDKYDAEVAYADQEVGRLVAWLRERYPDTMFVLTSDHGEGLRDHPGVPRSSTHGFTLYDSVMHVPLIVEHPSLAAGTRRPEMVQMLDLVPTLVDLFGLRLDAEVRGTSLAPMLRGEPAPDLAPQVFVDTQFNQMDKIGVREVDRKLIVNRDHQAYVRGDRPDLERLEAKKTAGARGALRAIQACGPRELYLLPGYENPVRGSLNMADAMPEEVARLERAIADFEERITARPPLNRDRNAEVDSTIVRQLEALGYLDE